MCYLCISYYYYCVRHRIVKLEHIGIHRGREWREPCSFFSLYFSFLLKIIIITWKCSGVSVFILVRCCCCYFNIIFCFFFSFNFGNEFIAGWYMMMMFKCPCKIETFVSYVHIYWPGNQRRAQPYQFKLLNIWFQHIIGNVTTCFNLVFKCMNIGNFFFYSFSLSLRSVVTALGMEKNTLYSSIDSIV